MATLTHASNPSTRETKAARWPVQVRPSLPSEMPQKNPNKTKEDYKPNKIRLLCL